MHLVSIYFYLTRINYIENNPNVGIVGPQLVYPDNNWQRSYGRIPSLSKAFFNIFFINFIEEHIKNILRKSRCKFDVRPKSVGYIVGAAMFFKKDLIQKIGYFDERFFFYAEDADFCLRTHKAGLDVVFIPSSHIVHYRGASSTADNSAMFNIQLLRANLQLVRKYSDKFKFFLYKTLIFMQLIARYSKNWLQFAIITFFGRGEYKREQQREKCKFIRELMFAVFHWKDKNIDRKRDNDKIIYVIIHNLPVWEKEGYYFLNSELSARDFMFHARFASRIILAVPPFKGNIDDFGVSLRHVNRKIEVIRYSQKNNISFLISIYQIIHRGSVIHYGWERSLLIGLVATLLKKRKILVLDADIIDEMRIASQNPFYSSRKRFLIKLYTAFLLIYIGFSGRLADIILSVGEGPANTLRELKLHKKTQIIIASNILSSEVLSQEKVLKKWQRKEFINIVVPAQLRYKKGFHVVLKALELLSKNFQSMIKVSIIGSGPLEGALKELARPLKEKVEFKHPTPYGPNFFRLLDEYQILIVSQLSNEQPRVLLDGMARGLLLIVSDTLGNKTIVSHGKDGLIYGKSDSSDLRNVLEGALGQYLQNPSAITKIVLEGLNFAKSHTVDSVHSKRDHLLIKNLGGKWNVLHCKSL